MNSDALYHKFACYVSSIQMADTITATYHWFEDGVEQTISEDYSIRQYISDFSAREESFDETTVALVHALADYGHYVQAFLTAQKGLTLGEDYAEMNLHFADSYDFDTIGAAVDGKAIVRENDTNGDVSKITYSLKMDSEIAIEVFFKMKSRYAGAFTVTLDDVTYTAVKESGRYVVRITNIPAHELGMTHIIEVTTANGTAHVEVSALSYVKSILDAYEDDVSRNTAAAIYAYAAAADAFVTVH
jgi:hypothetical protein